MSAYGFWRTPVLRGYDSWLERVPDDDPQGEQRHADLSDERCRLLDRQERLRCVGGWLNRAMNDQMSQGRFRRAEAGYHAWIRVERMKEDVAQRLEEIEGRGCDE